MAICWSLAASASLDAQLYPAPAGPPPAASAQVNASNPDQRVLVPRPGAPEPNYFNVSSVTQEVKGEWRYLRGRAVIETTEMRFSADEMDYNSDTGDAEARGNVKFEDYKTGDKIECDHARYNIDSQMGAFYDVKGTSPAKIQARPGLLGTNNPFYFEGKWAERKEDKYILHDGFITDCRVPNPWWVLRGPVFDIVPHERAIAYHSTFRLRGVPLFYAPALSKSLRKEQRQSGFLTPNIGHSSLRGYMVGWGYYWAINRSYDFMYRQQYFTERGFAHTVDFRGKVRPGTDFNVSLYGVNGRGLKIGTDGNGRSITQDQGGYFVSAQGRSDLGDGWQARGELSYLSSFLFRQSFTESFHEAVSSETHSVGFITKHWNSYGVNVVAQQDDEFLSTNPGDLVAIRKLPELQFLSREHQFNRKILPLWFAFDSSAGLLNRSEPDFSTASFVDRLEVNPRVTTAFHWAGFSLLPTFGLRETVYGASYRNGFVNAANYIRNSRELRVEFLTPSLARIYKAPGWLGDKMKHVIEPRAEYRYVDGVNDFNRIIRFDTTDLISNTNEVRISLTNRLFVKRKDGAVNEAVSWEVSQSRYFDPTFGGAVIPNRRNIVESSEELSGFAFLDGPRNYSPISSVLRIQQRIGIEWRADYDPLRRGIVNSGLTADARFSKYFVSVGDYQVHSSPVLSPTYNQARILVGVGNENRKGWNAAFSLFYDLQRNLTQFATVQVTYNTDCCGISMQYRRFNIGPRDEIQYRVAFAVANIGQFGTLKKQERIF